MSDILPPTLATVFLIAAMTAIRDGINLAIARAFRMSVLNAIRIRCAVKPPHERDASYKEASDATKKHDLEDCAGCLAGAVELKPGEWDFNRL